MWSHCRLVRVRVRIRVGLGLRLGLGLWPQRRLVLEDKRQLAVICHDQLCADQLPPVA